MSHSTTGSRSSFFPTGDSFETSDIATLLILAGASDADKTGWGDRRGGCRKYPGLDWCPACLGTAGWRRAPGAEGWPELCYCWAAGTSLLPQLLGMELLPHSRRSPEGCQHFGRKFCMDPLPPARVVDPSREGWGTWKTQTTNLRVPQTLQALPVPPNPVPAPNSMCHREAGMEPVLFIPSSLLWQPCVCLVFTSQDPWILPTTLVVLPVTG